MRYSSFDESGADSAKESRRESYAKKKKDKTKAERRPFKTNKKWKHSEEYKESMKVLNNDDIQHLKHLSLSPHFGLESITSASFALDALAKFSNIDLPDRVVREVEGVILLFTNLTQQTTSLGVVTSVLTWAQGRTSQSLFKTIQSYIEALLISPQSSTTPEWLDCLRDVRQNWQLCKSNRAFSQISRLLGCLVMLGLCDVADVTFNVGQFKLLAPELSDKHSSALDIADAIFETVVFFTEGAYLCFQSGSLRPLLVNDRTAMELDAEYAQIVSWYELVRNGNLKKFSEVSDQEFERRLNRLSTSLGNLAQSLRGLDKKLVLDKYQKILSIQNDFVAMKVASGVRHAPWAIEIFGESSQGKTTLGDQLIDAVLTSQGMPTDKEYRCAYNAGDKFMSNWTSDKLVMIFDDISNDKSNFVERPPTRAILDVINNQMFYAPKAELEAKGKCFVEPWIAMATTNKKDLDAPLYSNCPYSIQRRFVCLTVKAKPEFQRITEEGTTCGIDPAKVRAHYTVDGVYKPPMFDDIWSITVERAVKPPDLKSTGFYEPVVWRGQKLQDISMATCIQWAIEDFDNHKKNQDAILESMRARENNLVLCHHDGCKHLEGNCPYHTQLDAHFGVETIMAFRRLWHKACNEKPVIDRIYDRIDVDVAKMIYDKGTDYLASWSWIKIVPMDTLDNEYVKKALVWLHADKISDDYNWESKRLFLTMIFCMIVNVSMMPFLVMCCASFIILMVYLCTQRSLYDRVEKKLFDELREMNLDLAPVLRKYRDKYAKAICAASIGIAALYGLSRAYRAYRSNQQKRHGSLEPKTQEEIDQRDAEKDVWTRISKRDLPIGKKSMRMIAPHLDNVVHKNLVYGSIHLEGQNGMVNGLMLMSNVMLIPNHYFDELGDNLDCTFRKTRPDQSGGKFIARLHRSCSVRIPDTDLCMCYVPNGGSFKDITEYFPKGVMPSLPFRMHWRKKDGEIITAKGMTVPGKVRTYMEFEGGYYKNLTMNTFEGLCGATMVSDTNGSTILGVHLGGTGGTPIGCYGSLTQSQIVQGKEALRKCEGVLISGSAGSFEPVVLGVQVLKDDPLHKKSPLNYLPHDSQIEYYGSCPGRSVTKSNVKVTPISEHVLEICGVPNIYRGPKLNPEWYGWQTCLANLAIPAQPFPYGLLEIAVRDYKEDLLPIFQDEKWRSARPLTYKENLCGIPGKKFLDAIKLDTSVGFPLGGPKSEYVTLLEPTEEFMNNRELDQALIDEIDRIEACYRRGERGYPIAKACKKDEILTKEKCRIFYGNALSLTFLIRKYYLPLLRVLQMNPLKSECAVGVNSHGPEWEELHQHIVKHGMNRLFGGDYGKYDQKLPSQLILAALRVLIDCARVCNYSDDDIRIMEAMTGDIVFSYIAFNGDLIGLTEGTHISGNSLTVIINGICGSLNLRCYFYTQYPPTTYDERLKFRDCVSIMTYGDDNIGSVHSKIDKFTIKGCSEFLAKYGQVYTMPDKESELLDFLPEEEFEFLKRKSKYHPKLGCHVGMLLDKSIYKSLHCFMREKNSPHTEEHACAINIDGALREWFNHGEEKYEKQRALMKQVAEAAGISHMCNELNVTYNDRVAKWFETYM